MSQSLNQTTNHIMMVRPANFGFNEETAESNAFQNNDKSLAINQIREKAMQEFDAFVAELRKHGVQVLVMEDKATPFKTDAVFPNNWITFHQDGTIITYPMLSKMRRLERDMDFVKAIDNQFIIKNHIQLEAYESKGVFLEGTGSMILDRVNKIVYACLSPRTDEHILDDFCSKMCFQKVAFTATDGNGQEIYHTNVMMALGETFAVICMATIKDEKERKAVRQILKTTNKAIINISLRQMLNFAGNMLQVRNEKGNTFLVMSATAYKSLTKNQVTNIKKHTNIIIAPIPTIEKYGGGSARCMMAEVFLEKK